MVSVMLLYLAARDPERNVAIIDAISVGLWILAITPMIAFVRLALAGVLFYLGPKSTGWKTCGEFLKNEREGQDEETWPGVTPFAFGRA